MSFSAEEQEVFEELREEVQDHGMVLAVCVCMKYISQAAAKWLAAYCADGGEGQLIVASYPEGWWIAVPPLDDVTFLAWAEQAELPSSLLLVLRHATELHAQWVQLDRGGDEWDDDLPAFDW